MTGITAKVLPRNARGIGSPLPFGDERRPNLLHPEPDRDSRGVAAGSGDPPHRRLRDLDGTRVSMPASLGGKLIRRMEIVTPSSPCDRAGEGSRAVAHS